MEGPEVDGPASAWKHCWVHVCRPTLECTNDFNSLCSILELGKQVKASGGEREIGGLGVVSKLSADPSLEIEVDSADPVPELLRFTFPR